MIRPGAVRGAAVLVPVRGAVRAHGRLGVDGPADLHQPPRRLHQHLLPLPHRQRPRHLPGAWRQARHVQLPAV